MTLYLLVNSSFKCDLQEGVDLVRERGVLAHEPGGVAHVRDVRPGRLVGQVHHALPPYVVIDRSLLGQQSEAFFFYQLPDGIRIITISVKSARYCPEIMRRWIKYGFPLLSINTNLKVESLDWFQTLMEELFSNIMGTRFWLITSSRLSTEPT